MIVCPKCGYENRDGVLLCNLCGGIFRKENAISRAAVGLAGSVPAAQATASAAPRREGAPVRRDFWTEQANNRRGALLLVVAVAAILVFTGGVFGEMYGSPWVGLIVAASIAVVLLLVAWFQGDALVLSLSGAREVRREELPVLWNVTEEMAIAAGLPMPRLYLIEDSAPNAFATGRDASRAAVCVTRGLVDKMSRDELQGVIAHEMSHVRNQDVLYMTLVGVLVGSVALLCDGFLRSMRFGGRGLRGSRGRASGAVALAVVIVALLLAVIAPLVAHLLRMAVSRRREFLADASGVELTRNPLGLASALEKIAADPDPLEAANRATQHLYIVNPIKEFGMKSSALLSTHPPTEARIRILRSMAA